MGLKDIFKTAGTDPTMGFADSKTAQNLSENLNLGKVADGLHPDQITGKIKANAIANVIAYEGGNDTFIWKHPVEDFNIGSQLIVHESQEAIFYMNGQALDLFGPGRHTLQTQNLPLIGKFLAAPLGGQTPFHCEVYFINKTEQLEVKWGTDSKLEYREPTHGFPIQIGASGAMSLRVDDSRKLLVKVVGTERGLTQQAFIQKMRSIMMVAIKNHLTSYIMRNNIDIFLIDMHLADISAGLIDLLKPDFLDYGVSMERFQVSTIVKPEDDPTYKMFKEREALKVRRDLEVGNANIQVEVQKTKIVGEAEAIAQKRAIEGYTYADERGFDVAEKVASNEAVGQMTNMGVGLGVMAGVGAPIGGMVGGVMQNTMGAVLGGAGGQPFAAGAAGMAGAAQQAQQMPQAQQVQGAAIPCSKCGKPLPGGAKFCLECGQPVLSDDEIICPSCGVKTPKGKFCLECGTALVRKCSSCGTEIPPNGKFCLECGKNLADS